MWPSTSIVHEEKINHVIRFHSFLCIRDGWNGFTMYDKIDISTKSAHYSDISLFRHLVIPTSRYSDISLFRHLVIPTSRYSDISLFRHLVIPTFHIDKNYSDIFFNCHFVSQYTFVINNLHTSPRPLFSKSTKSPGKLFSRSHQFFGRIVYTFHCL